MFYDDTIAAIATSSINGGISIIRISGENAIAIADRVVEFSNLKLSDSKSHTVHYGFVVDDKKQRFDEVIVLLMKGPNSYTKEDVVEIQCHGGVLICQEILELVLKNGARIAEPGEFTKRAFLNGRIDLSQAEAVMDLIQSKSRYAMESSMSQLGGIVKKKIVSLRNQILDDVAFIEAALDDPEHITLDGFEKSFLDRLDHSILELEKIRDNYNNGRMIKEGVQTVIVGRPNVGKSSFLNTILGADRAIVTDVPGTTRDTLEEDVRLGDILLHVIDTAGIHETDDVVEKIGIEKALNRLKTSDFCILILDGSYDLTNEDISLIEKTEKYTGVILVNKNDLDQNISIDQILKYTNRRVIPFSARTGYGLDELEKYIKEQFYLENISFNDEIYISNERQKQAIMDSYESLLMVKKSVNDQMGEDFYTIDLMNAYEKLGSIIGESVDDDLVDTIFSKFCMGK